MATTDLNTIEKNHTSLIYDPGAGTPINDGDTENSVQAAGANIIHVEPPGATTTATVQVKVTNTSTWVAIATVAASATVGAVVDVSAYNFSRVIRATGAQDFKVWAQY